MRNTNRRSFLKYSAAAGGMLAISPRSWAATSGSEEVRLGLIGCGGRGGQLLSTFARIPGVVVAGLCDPDQKRLNGLSEKYPDAKTWVDLRGLLDSNEIDAVVIAACNHWHCLASIWAMDAGKHVYVEKPLSNSVWEGEQVIKAAEKHQKICSVGTQQRSDPMQAEIKEFLHGDESPLGAIEWVRANRFGVRESIGKREIPLQIPSSVDYELWLGPAHDEPLYRDNLQYDWHWDWNTGAGEMGNWGVHIIDDVRNNVFLDRVAFPEKVVAAGGRFQWHDAGNTPNVHFSVLDTGAIPVVIALSNLPQQGGRRSGRPMGPGSGYVVHCEGGRLEGQRGRAAAFDEAGEVIKEFKGTGGGNEHAQNFIDAVRQQDASMINAPLEVGHHSTSWCNFANFAYRVGSSGAHSADSVLGADFGIEPAERVLNRMRRGLSDAEGAELKLSAVLRFDSSAGQFVGDHAAAANQLVRPEVRSPFAIPEVS